MKAPAFAARSRIIGLHRDTILRVLVAAGEKSEKLMGRLLINIPVKNVEADKIWGFIQKKEGHRRPEEANDETIGDAYTFVAMERNTKLALNFALGRRNQATIDIFIEGLRAATASQGFQITTDGFLPYRNAIPNPLEARCDFAQLIKVYRSDPEGEDRYSPADVVSTEAVQASEDPILSGSTRLMSSARTSR